MGISLLRNTFKPVVDFQTLCRPTLTVVLTALCKAFLLIVWRVPPIGSFLLARPRIETVPFFDSRSFP